MQLDADTRNECLTCGNNVSSQFGSVFGDQDGGVHRCLECDTMGRIKHGSAAGVRVSSPDPLEHPGRMPDTPEIDARAVSRRGGRDE